MITIDPYMYSKFPNFVFGFHGCNRETFENVIFKGQDLEMSHNKYDWLGNGIYFWENGLQRAYEWAKKYPEPAVIGAIIDLGNCLNLTDYYGTDVLSIGYDLLKSRFERKGEKMPQNRNIKNSNDWLLRNLDCAVIQEIHTFNKENNLPAYDSVRGIFQEGKAAYPGSGFKAKTHIQICVTNPNCIKGYFNPLSRNSSFPLP